MSFWSVTKCQTSAEHALIFLFFSVLVLNNAHIYVDNNCHVCTLHCNDCWKKCCLFWCYIFCVKHIFYNDVWHQNSIENIHGSTGNHFAGLFWKLMHFNECSQGPTNLWHKLLRIVFSPTKLGQGFGLSLSEFFTVYRPIHHLVRQHKNFQSYPKTSPQPSSQLMALYVTRQHKRHWTQSDLNIYAHFPSKMSSSTKIEFINNRLLLVDAQTWFDHLQDVGDDMTEEEKTASKKTWVK